MRVAPLFPVLLACLGLSWGSWGQVPPLEIRQTATPVNLQSYQGAPLSSVPGDPPGSDGRAPTPQEQAAEGLTTTQPSDGQFQSFAGFGALAVALAPQEYDENASLAVNAVNTQLPVGRSGSQVVVIMKSAMAGAPYLSRQVSFLFGSLVAVPRTDESGKLLAEVRPDTRPEDYWLAEPQTTNNHQGAGYYWSAHAKAVFAIQPGPVSITWKRSQPSGTEADPPDDNDGTNYSIEAGRYYRLYPVRYVVSGSAVKPPRKMYWTERVFRNIGKPVTVPTARVGAVQVVYNSNFPNRVDKEYVVPGEVPIVEDPNDRLQETRTLWYEQQQGQILAYNREGRVFVELLGDLREDGQSRKHLGFEIVDVLKQPNPDDVTTELGERLTAWQDVRPDAHLVPEPILATGSQGFTYRHALEGGDRFQFYATRETQNLNDLQVHWLEAGDVGLRWPFRLVRYRLVWPPDVGRYSHYARPLVSNEAEARDTAVPLPLDNVPVIDYQDPLDRPRAKLTEQFEFYTYLEPAQPVHRTLLRFSAGDQIAFERVFSWLDTNLKNGAFAGTIATNLNAWHPAAQVMVWSDDLLAPRVVSQTVPVGERLRAPTGELGAGSGQAYWAGHIRQAHGNSFHPEAYVDPFVAGFETANIGAIIPVNAIPGSNELEVWWFRKNAADAVQGFKAVHWPSVIGRYTLEWPASPREIVLASNDGSGGLSSLEAQGRIYYQNDPAAAGYNPNEEHALMIAGQAYALREDLNLTTASDYSSEPYVLLDYTEADRRPALSVFKVLREKPEQAIVFDYLVEAATILQAPMPLPLIEKPVEGSGPNAVNFNTEPPAAGGDLPGNWNDAAHGDGPFAHYARFTYRDRKEEHWVYRGLHAGTPPLDAGSYNPGSGAFDPLPPATAVAGLNFNYAVHASRLSAGLTMQEANTTPLPAWLRIEGLSLVGRPGLGDTGALALDLVLTATDDGSQVTRRLALTVAETGAVVAQGPLEIVSHNAYASADVTYTGRPPYLATSPAPTNSFTMRFYYKTRAGFAWPGVAVPPPVGSIVPYLRPKDAQGQFVGDPASKQTPSLEIVYRPYWPFEDRKLPKLLLGETLMTPKRGLPDVRGQTSLQILYQQSVAADLDRDADVSGVLHDATREKAYDISAQGLERLPAGLRTDSYQGKLYFPNLPPHLAQRLFFDPNRGTKGHLVLRGEYRDELVGEKYVLLNVLRGNDLAKTKGLCPAGDTDKAKWDLAVDGLATVLETFREDPDVPGTFIPEPTLNRTTGVGALAEITDADTAVDSYALSASGPGTGYLTLIAGNGWAFTPQAEPVSMYVIKVTDPLYAGEVKVIAAANPLDEQSTFQHTADLAGRFDEYEYDWRIAPPVDGQPPEVTLTMDAWTVLTQGNGLPQYTLGGAGIQALTDNYVVMRYRAKNPAHPLLDQWSGWTEPQLAEGWIKRVLAGINPFNQRVNDLFNNAVNTDVSLLTQAGPRWEGDIALNLANIDDYGLIEIYETVLRRGKMLSVGAGINYGPANDALLLAAGYLNDLYVMLGNEAWADAANPTIGIGTKDHTYGDVATALFAFKGQMASLLEEELALLRGRDDFLQPGVETPPVYNRLFWNYTRGIDAGEVIYALNYNIKEDQDGGVDGVVNAADALVMFPQGHGDAYGHYLTALKGYYAMLLDTDFDWVPRTEAVTVLGKPIQVDYLDERKFAAAAGSAARAGRQIFDLTWRMDYQPGEDLGWEHFAGTRANPRREVESTRYWGLDHWASRIGHGAYLNWVVGNAILPDLDPDPDHEGIQKIDRTTVPELAELVDTFTGLQTALDNAEGRVSPLGLPESSLAFDINPILVVGGNSATHFEQIYDRAKAALHNALAAFDDAKDVTRLMRSEQDSLAEFQAAIAQQELSYKHALIELYGTPYPDDIGPGKTYQTSYDGPDFYHFMYVNTLPVNLEQAVHPSATQSFTMPLDVQNYPGNWVGYDRTVFDFIERGKYPNETGFPDGYTEKTASNLDGDYINYTLASHGFFQKPATWTGQRASPGRLQRGISAIIQAHNDAYTSLKDYEAKKYKLDRMMDVFASKKSTHETVRDWRAGINTYLTVYENAKAFAEVFQAAQEIAIDVSNLSGDVLEEALPQSLVFGLANGGDVTSAARAALEASGAVVTTSLKVGKLIKLTLLKALERATVESQRWIEFTQIGPAEWQQTLREEVFNLDMALGDVQLSLYTIYGRLEKLNEAYLGFQAVVAEGDRLQKEREIYRQRAAAVIQGFRTRDAGFRIFRNEKLERYKTLFDLAAQYALLAANAYDYETGLLHTQQGRAFVNRIIRSRALGVVRNGEPQFAGSDTGDPGLSSALAEMKADWDVLKGRLGFNNPDGYGTTVSLRTEQHRILPGVDGQDAWRDVLHQGLKSDLLEDEDVRRYCLQIGGGGGLPVPGIVLEFSTTIADGLNLFGRPLAGGDHGYSPSSFATKLFAVGVALEGYEGMDDPAANLTALALAGATSPSDPDVRFLDPDTLAATPYVYLIPVGTDSIRTPPLGDTSAIRTWHVEDITIPLPFNIGGSEFSTRPIWQSSDFLSEPIFGVRKHQAFRPVSNAAIFAQNIFGASGQLLPSQFTNRRLIGRSVWNSKWKLIIPGHTLFNDPKEGLDRFVRTVTDVQLHFVTYSYSGN